MAKMGRPQIEIDKKQFEDLCGLGCTQEEICWWFRDAKGKPISVDTITRWCKRTYGMTFAEYFKSNGGMQFKMALRRNQLALSKKSAAMAIFLGKNYLGQRDHIEYEDTTALEKLDSILAEVKENAFAETE